MEEIGAAILLPLLFETKLIGIILIGEKANQEGFSAQEISLLGHLSHQASVALKNATIFAEVRKRAVELAKFYRLTVERELKMRKLEQRIKELEERIKEAKKK